MQTNIYILISVFFPYIMKSGYLVTSFQVLKYQCTVGGKFHENNLTAKRHTQKYKNHSKLDMCKLTNPFTLLYNNLVVCQF